MSYRGIKSKDTRSPRTIGEQKGTLPAGFAGSMTYSYETGTVEGQGKPTPQPYEDVAMAAMPSAGAAKKPASLTDKKVF